MPYLLLPLLLLLSLPAHAVIQKFGANEHNTVWISEGDNKFRCSLKQTIPNFGEVTFKRIAGDKLQLKFELIHPNRAEREVEFISRPPLWRHQQGSRLLDTLQLNEPSDKVKFNSQQARVALTELEQGLFPTIRYHVEEDGDREVNAAISSVNFQPPYNQFLTCLSKLMPYQFEYVEDSKFYFRPGSSKLSAIDKRRLNEIVTYIKADPAVKWAHIKGYTDSKGFRHMNDKLGERRAKTIQDYLASYGINGVDIALKSYGERMPIESNRTSKGRSNNRVAIFTLFNKEPPPPEALPEFEFENIFDNLPGREPEYQAPKPREIPRLKPSTVESLLKATSPQKKPAASPESEPPLVAPIDAAEAESAPATPAPETEEAPPSSAPSLFAPITSDMVETGK